MEKSVCKCRKKVVHRKKEIIHTKHRIGIYEKYIKRFLDVMLSASALIVLSPLMVILAIIVRCKLGTPVIFRQKRPGKDEKIFEMYKFRSMTDEKDENGELLPDGERLTEVGRKLRNTSLDELPELFNVLKGDMSIVGPRPLLVRYLPYYTEKERHRHDVRPGITGLAQVSGRNYLKWEERFALDVKYTEIVSFVNDCRIVLKTVKKVLSKQDVMDASDERSMGKLGFQNLDVERRKVVLGGE